MFCAKCGAKNDDNGKFCELCGASLAGMPMDVTQPQPQPQSQSQPQPQPQMHQAVYSSQPQSYQQQPYQQQPYQQQPYQQQPYQQQPYQQQPYQPGAYGQPYTSVALQPKKKNTALIVIIIALVVVIAAVAVYFFLLKPNNSIVGTWTDSATGNPDDGTYTYTFRSNGTATSDASGDQIEATYKIKGNTIELTDSDGNTSSYQFVIKKIGGKDVLTVTDNGDIYTMYRVANQTSNSSSSTAKPATSSSIVGTWGDSASDETSEDYFTVTFRKDGTVTEEGSAYQIDGTYKVSGDQLTMTDSDGNKDVFTIKITKVGGKDVLTVTADGESQTLNRLK